jgi:hypothetical protein
MDEHEETIAKSSHCNDFVIEQNKAPADSNVTGMCSFVPYNIYLIGIILFFLTLF